MLHYRVVGEGSPLVIVHGLFGSGDNWATLAGKFAGYRVYLPDLRNHGLSPWEESFSGADLGEDLAELAEGLGLEKCPWIGHSLGGKAVLELALRRPDLVSGVAILDMAPRESEARYPGFVEAMRDLDLRSVASRSEAQALLSPSISDLPTLQFLLKSLVPDPSRPGSWMWRLNLASLEANYHEVWKAMPRGRTWSGPALFLRGGASDYVRDQDIPLILEFCPQATIKSIEGAGHWLHAEKPSEVVGALLSWLRQLE